MKNLGSVDAGSYVRALALLARHPALVVAPLLMSVFIVVLGQLFAFGGGGAGPLGIASLIYSLLDSFGLAVSIILADLIWRRGRAPFDEAWNEGRRKAPEILLAAVGFNFVQWVATLVGGIFGAFGLVLEIVATYLFIYTIAAAAIGGVPGAAALQVSMERVQRSYANSALVTAIYLVVSLVIEPAIFGTLLAQTQLPTIAVSLVGAIVKSFGSGYLALVLAKGYADASYGRFFR